MKSKRRLLVVALSVGEDENALLNQMEGALK